MRLVIPGCIDIGMSKQEKWTNKLVGKKLSDSTSDRTVGLPPWLPTHQRCDWTTARLLRGRIYLNRIESFVLVEGVPWIIDVRGISSPLLVAL